MILYNRKIWKRCFCYNKKYWYKNIKEIPRYFRDLHYLIKHGHDICANWNVDIWFSENMIEILTTLRDHHCGVPTIQIDESVDPNDVDKQDEAYVKLLNRMIFLLGESNESTCKKKNPYDDEYWKIYDEFEDKYGSWGCKLQTEYEKNELANKGFHRLYTPRDVPEYENIAKKHLEADIELEKYREECLCEFMDLFKKYYYCLWD